VVGMMGVMGATDRCRFFLLLGVSLMVRYYQDLRKERL
jgi:hypothetical protein